jgi:ACS family hexuronate transporter-like MFS transporter
VCVLLLLASTLNYMDRMALNQTSPRIKEVLGISNFWYSTLESVFTIGFAIGTLTAGWLVDRVSVRWVYPAAVLGWSAFGFLTGFAPGYWVLFACRLGLGVFEAGNWPCGIRTTRHIMGPSERSLGNAFFQNGTAIGAIVTPPIVLWCVSGTELNDPTAWQVPFRVIGAVGLLWVVLWFASVPGRVVQTSGEGAPSVGEAAPFTTLFSDRRYWLLVALVLAVNTSWHTFRVWLPLFLQKQQGYTEAEMSYLTTLYYVAADVGAWVVGLGSFVLARRGMSVHGSRVISFAACTGLVLVGLALPFTARGATQVALLLVFGFGAFGLFPTYFALSQDLSARHQGKVTGTLGAINAAYLAALYPLEGVIADTTKRYDQIMSIAGLPALLALVAVWTWWPRGKSDEHSA